MKRIIGWTSVIWMALPLTAAAATCPSWQKADPSAWTCLAFDAAQNQAVPAAAAISDQKGWTAFWTARTGQDAAPAVDFSREMLAVVPAGDGQTMQVVRLDKNSPQAKVFAQQRRSGGLNLRLAADRVSALLAGFGSMGGDNGSALAVSGEFDGIALNGGSDAGVSLNKTATLGPTNAALVAQQCTPGVDCPQTPPSPSNPPSCTPGVDCPPPPSNSPGCTPGVDCPPGSGNGSGGQSGGGTTPLPPNYQPQPSNPPDVFPPIVNPQYNDGSVVGGWNTYLDVFGDPVEHSGSWSNTTAQATVTRGGSEVGSQQTAYTATLQSQAQRNVYRLYWRYVGENCDPNDSSQCVNWYVQYAYFFDRTDNGQSSVMNVEVDFSNDKPLLPWEKDVIVLSYDGSNISVDQSGAAFNYAVRGPIVDQQNNTAVIILTPGARILRAPEADKVHLVLENSGGRLLLSVSDDRTSYYNGQTLEIAVKIKKDSGHWWKGDQTVVEYKQNGPLSVIVDQSKPTHVLADLSYLGSGKFYVADWSFSRAASKISSSDWVDEGKGGSIQR